MFKRVHGGSWLENVIDFSANLNPLGVPEEIERKVKACIGKDVYKYYPDPNYVKLKETLSTAYNVETRSIVVTNGASEALSLSLLCLVNRGVRKTILISPTYGEDEISAASEELGLKVSYSLLKEGEEDFRLNVNEVLKELNLSNGILLIMSNPNNPTGTYIERDYIEEILEVLKGRGYLLIDEAYIEFSGSQGYLDLIDNYENLLIVRTLTKFLGSPGLRVGFLASGNNSLIECIDKIRPTWNIDSLSACVISGEPLSDAAWLSSFRQRTLSEVSELRKDLERKLRGLGFRTYRSRANFILAKGDFQDPKAFYEELRVRRVKVRNCQSFRGLGSEYFRVAVRDPSAQGLLLRALEEVLSLVS